MSTPDSTPAGGNPNPDGSRGPSPFPATEADNRAATQYVEAELGRTRKSLVLTRWVGGLLTLAALIEMIYVAGQLHHELQPREAAQTATGIITQRLDEQSDAIRQGIAERVPQLIAQIPDQAIAQLPNYRQQLENRLTDQMTTYATSTSTQLNTQLTSYLQSHKDEVHQALQSGNSSAVAQQLGQQLTDQFVKTLQTQQTDGETIQGKIDTSLTDLQQVKSKMDRLAANKGLTPDEKRTRHMIAIMAHTLEAQTPKVNVNQAITGASSAVQGTVTKSL